MRILTLFAALGLALPVQLLAAPDTSTQPPAEAAKPQKICREVQAKTGSRMGSGRKCKTPAEWSAIDSGKQDVRVQERQIGAISRTN